MSDQTTETATEPRRLSRDRKPTAGAYVQKEFILRTDPAKRIWNRQSTEMDDRLYMVQEVLAERMHDEAYARIEEAVKQLIRETQAEVLAACRTADQTLGTDKTLPEYETPRTIVCRCHTPAMRDYIEVLQELDSLMMMSDALWLNGRVSSQDRAELRYRWRDAFHRLNRKILGVIGDAWTEVKKMQAAAGENGEVLPEENDAAERKNPPGRDVTKDDVL